MEIDITILIGIIGAVISVASFFLGRQQTAKKDGADAKEMRVLLEHMKSDLMDIKAQIKVMGDKVSKQNTTLAVTQRDLKTCFNRIDDVIEKNVKLDARITELEMK